MYVPRISILGYIVDLCATLRWVTPFLTLWAYRRNFIRQCKTAALTLTSVRGVWSSNTQLGQEPSADEPRPLAEQMKCLVVRNGRYSSWGKVPADYNSAIRFKTTNRSQRIISWMLFWEKRLICPFIYLYVTLSIHQRFRSEQVWPPLPNLFLMDTSHSGRRKDHTQTHTHTRYLFRGQDSFQPISIIILILLQLISFLSILYLGFLQDRESRTHVTLSTCFPLFCGI